MIENAIDALDPEEWRGRMTCQQHPTAPGAPQYTTEQLLGAYEKRKERWSEIAAQVKDSLDDAQLLLVNEHLEAIDGCFPDSDHHLRSDVHQARAAMRSESILLTEDWFFAVDQPDRVVLAQMRLAREKLIGSPT